MELPPTHRVRSSFFYFLILQIDWIWNFVNTIVILVLQSLKVYSFPMTYNSMVFSVIAPLFLCVLCLLKINIAKPGNRSESSFLIIIAILFCLGCGFMDIYFIYWQPYEWSWELTFHIISLVMEGIIFLFSCLMMIVFLGGK